MMNIENEEEIIQRGYNVIVKNSDWVEYLKGCNNQEGLIWANDDILVDIKDALYLDNPLHSASSLAITINKCKKILNNIYND